MPFLAPFFIFFEREEILVLKFSFESRFRTFIVLGEHSDIFVIKKGVLTFFYNIFLKFVFSKKKRDVFAVKVNFNQTAF